MKQKPKISEQGKTNKANEVVSIFIGTAIYIFGFILGWNECERQFPDGVENFIIIGVIGFVGLFGFLIHNFNKKWSQYEDK